MKQGEADEDAQPDGQLAGELVRCQGDRDGVRVTPGRPDGRGEGGAGAEEAARREQGRSGTDLPAAPPPPRGVVDSCPPQQPGRPVAEPPERAAGRPDGAVAGRRGKERPGGRAPGAAPPEAR